MPGERQTILIFGGWQEKAKARVMRVFLRRRRVLLHWWPWRTTSLMASMPRCPEVTASKTICGGKRKLISTVINGHALKMPHAGVPQGSRRWGFTQRRGTIHNGHYCSLKHHLALVIGPNLLNLRRKGNGLQGCSRWIGCLSDAGVYSRGKSRLYHWGAVAACVKSARFRLRLYSQTIQLDSRTLGVRAKERRVKDSGMHALC